MSILKQMALPLWVYELAAGLRDKHCSVVFQKAGSVGVGTFMGVALQLLEELLRLEDGVAFDRDVVEQRLHERLAEAPTRGRPRGPGRPTRAQDREKAEQLRAVTLVRKAREMGIEPSASALAAAESAAILPRWQTHPQGHAFHKAVWPCPDRVPADVHADLDQHLARGAQIVFCSRCWTVRLDDEMFAQLGLVARDVCPGERPVPPDNPAQP